MNKREEPGGCGGITLDHIASLGNLELAFGEILPGMEYQTRNCRKSVNAVSPEEAASLRLKLGDIREKLLSGAYRVSPERTLLEFSDGLSFSEPSPEDRLVQQAVGRVLEHALEPSYFHAFFLPETPLTCYPELGEQWAAWNMANNKKWVAHLTLRYDACVRPDGCLRSFRKLASKISDEKAVSLLLRILGDESGGTPDIAAYSGRGLLRDGCLSRVLAGIYFSEFDGILEELGVEFVRATGGLETELLFAVKSKRALASKRDRFDRMLDDNMSVSIKCFQTEMIDRLRESFMFNGYWYGPGFCPARIPETDSAE